MRERELKEATIKMYTYVTSVGGPGITQGSGIRTGISYVLLRDTVGNEKVGGMVVVRVQECCVRIV